MTLKNTIAFLIILTSTFGFTQKVTRFTLLDSNPFSGTYTTWQIKYADNNAETCEPESMKFIDSIVWFMTNHPFLTIEIQDHRDKSSSIEHSLKSAMNIVDILTKKGISSSRLSAKGFAGIKPYVPDSVIWKAKSKEIAEKMRLKSRRTVLKITCSECLSKENLRKARNIEDLFNGFIMPGEKLAKSNGYIAVQGSCELSGKVNGKFRTAELRGSELSGDARAIVDGADIGSKLFIDCQGCCSKAIGVIR